MVAGLVRYPDGGVNEQMFLALRTTLSLDDALDLLELDQWSQSVGAAAQRNTDALNKILAERNGHDR
jgi:hypothetical protein